MNDDKRSKIKIMNFFSRIYSYTYIDEKNKRKKKADKLSMRINFLKEKEGESRYKRSD